MEGGNFLLWFLHVSELTLTTKYEKCLSDMTREWDVRFNELLFGLIKSNQPFGNCMCSRRASPPVLMLPDSDFLRCPGQQDSELFSASGHHWEHQLPHRKLMGSKLGIFRVVLLNC